MPKRSLRIVKPTAPLLGVCERCNSQFRSNLPRLADAQVEIASAFDAHKCILLDSSQNALRVVREATENK
jgi:hypothetical protein